MSQNCPRCGHELIFRHGLYGQFIGCSHYPVCTFTMNKDGTPTKRKREVEEWDENGKPTSYIYAPIPKEKPKRTCPYGKCKGDGLIPFVNKEGKTIPYTWLFCDCHPQYGIYVHDYDQPLRPEDYDFPISSDFRAFTYSYCGVPDPGYIPPEPKVKEEVEVKFVYEHSNLTKDQSRKLDDCILQIRELKRIINIPKRKKGKYD